MNIITNPNFFLHVSLDKDTSPTLAGYWFALEEVQEQEAKCRQCIDKQHMFCQYDTSRQDCLDSNTREQPRNSLPYASEGTPEGEILFAPEVALLSAPEVSSAFPTSHRLDYVPEGDNNVDNDNGTASGRTYQNRRVQT